MKTNKSISFDESILEEIRHEATETQLSFSQVVNDKLKKSFFSDEDVIDINKTNNKIILLNNKIILLCNQIYKIKETEIKNKEKELNLVKGEQAELVKSKQDRYDELKGEFKILGVLKEIEQCKAEEWLKLVDKYLEKGLEIDGSKILEYKRLQHFGAKN